jgi:phage terminase large subunit-like protein
MIRGSPEIGAATRAAAATALAASSAVLEKIAAPSASRYVSRAESQSSGSEMLGGVDK